VHVLAGRNDPIMPAAMTEHGFAGHPIHWHDGGHLLPLTHPKWCADKIRECL
jgi:pimeloyl-[acyl-carrier protein] methyl ester esterase